MFRCKMYKVLWKQAAVQVREQRENCNVDFPYLALGNILPSLGQILKKKILWEELQAEPADSLDNRVRPKPKSAGDQD